MIGRATLSERGTLKVIMWLLKFRLNKALTKIIKRNNIDDTINFIIMINYYHV